MDVEFAINPDRLDVSGVCSLMEEAGMRQRDIRQMQKAIKHSSDVVVVYANHKVIGFGRMLSDAHYYGAIWDVAVKPEYRHRHIGTQIMEHLLRAASRKNLHMIGLFTAGSNRSFYERQGFTFHDDIHAMTNSLEK